MQCHFSSIFLICFILYTSGFKQLHLPFILYILLLLYIENILLRTREFQSNIKKKTLSTRTWINEHISIVFIYHWHYSVSVVTNYSLCLSSLLTEQVDAQFLVNICNKNRHRQCLTRLYTDISLVWPKCSADLTDTELRTRLDLQSFMSLIMFIWGCFICVQVKK